MAKITTTTTKNSNRTPKGTMPKDQLARFAMAGNIGSSEGTGEGSLSSSHHRRKFIKRNTERWSTLRLLAGSKSVSLPSPLKSAIRYFTIPMGRDNSVQAAPTVTPSSGKA